MHRVPSMHASNYEHIRATTKHARSKNGNLMTAKCELLGRPSAVYKFSCINYKEDAAYDGGEAQWRRSDSMASSALCTRVPWFES